MRKYIAAVAVVGAILTIACMIARWVDLWSGAPWQSLIVLFGVITAVTALLFAFVSAQKASQETSS